MVLGNIGQRIRDSITGTISGAGDVLESTVTAAKEVTVGTLSGSREVVGAVSKPGERRDEGHHKRDRRCG